MRRHALLIPLMIVLTGSAAAAQDRGGVLAGVNFATLHIDFPPVVPDEFRVSFDRRTSVTAGVYGVVPLGRSAALEPGVMFSGQGGKLTAFGDTGTLTINYVTLPTLMRASVPVGGGSVRLFAGPSLAFKVSAKAKSPDGKADDVLEDNIRAFDFGIVVGGGIAAGRFVADTRYTHGLRDIVEIPDGSGLFRNRVFSLLAGVRF